MSTNIGSLVTYLSADVTGMRTGMRSAIRQVNTYVAAANKGASAAAASVVTIGAAVASMAAISVYSFATFDDKMTKSTALLLDATEEQKRAMADMAQQVSMKGRASANELADAYMLMGSTGLNAAQQMALLPLVEKFSRAGALDMATANTVLIDTVNALGLSTKNTSDLLRSATRVSDVLVKANIVASGTVNDFATALTKRAISAMRLYKVSLEEGVAVLAAFAKQGIKGAIAGRYFDIMLREITNKNIKFRDSWEQMGIKVFDTAGKLRPIADIILDFENALGGLDDESKTVAMSMLGLSSKSQHAVKSMIGFSEVIRKFNQDMEEATNSTEIIAEKGMQSLAAKTTKAVNGMIVLTQMVGESISAFLYLKDILDGVNWGLEKLTSFKGLGDSLKTENITGKIPENTGILSFIEDFATAGKFWYGPEETGEMLHITRTKKELADLEAYRKDAMAKRAQQEKELADEAAKRIEVQTQEQKNEEKRLVRRMSLQEKMMFYMKKELEYAVKFADVELDIEVSEAAKMAYKKEELEYAFKSRQAQDQITKNTLKEMSERNDIVKSFMTDKQKELALTKQLLATEEAIKSVQDKKLAEDLVTDAVALKAELERMRLDKLKPKGSPQSIRVGSSQAVEMMVNQANNRGTEIAYAKQSATSLKKVEGYQAKLVALAQAKTESVEGLPLD